MGSPERMNQGTPSNQGTYEKNAQASKNMTLELIRRTDETIAALNSQIREAAATFAGLQSGNKNVDVSMLKAKIELLKSQLADAQARRDKYKKDIQDLGFHVG